MTDPLRQFQPGERFVPRANTLNAFVEAARAHRDAPADERPGDLAVNARTILVKNQTGWTLPRHACVALDEPIVLPADNPAEFAKRVAFRGVAPLEGVHEGKWAVLAEPLGDGKIGRAWAWGVFPALVGVTEETEGFTRCEVQQEPPGGPEPGGEGYVLKLDPRGTGEVLWIEAGTGIKQAVVRLDGGFVEVDTALLSDILHRGIGPVAAERGNGEAINVHSTYQVGYLGKGARALVVRAGGTWYAIGWALRHWRQNATDDVEAGQQISLGNFVWGTEDPVEQFATAMTDIAMDDAMIVLWDQLAQEFFAFVPGAPAPVLGCGLKRDEETGVVSIDPEFFRDGLKFTAADPEAEPPETCRLDVNAGCGLRISDDEGTEGQLQLDPESIGDGLEFFDCLLSVKTGCGLMIDGGGNVAVDSDDLAGAGLVPGSGCALDVNPGEGITVAGDAVGLDIPSLPADSTPQETDVVATHDGDDHRRVTVEDVRGFLGDHKDTEIAGAQLAQVLKFVDPFWSNAFLHLYELADTLIQNPVAGHHLKHDGSKWINYLPDSDANFHGCCGWVWNATAEDWCWKFGDCDPEEDKPATPPPFTPYDGQLVIICEACGKPSICVAAIGDPIAEDGEAGAFRVCRTGSTEEPLVVHFTLSGTAVEGTDYETLDDNTEATIPIGESCVDVVIIPIDNTEVDDPQNRTVILTLDADAAYSINPECDEATLTIEDDEEPPPPPGETDYVLSGGFDGEAVNVAMLDGFSSSVLTSMGGPSSLGDWRGAGSDGTDTPHAGSKNFNPNEETVYWFAGQFTSTLLASVTDEDVMFFVEASDDGTDTLAGVIHNSTSETMRLYSGKITSTILDQQSPSEGIAGGISTDGTDMLVSGGDRLLKYAGILSTTKLEDVTIGTGSFTGNHGITWNGENPVFLDSESDPVSINEQDGWTTTTLSSVDVSSIITSDPPLGIEAEDPAVRLST